MLRSQRVEKGDVFFFYRPRVGVAELKDLTQVQRFYMVLAADENDAKRTFRILAIGGKRLPDIDGTANPDERHWATIARTTTAPNVVREELSAKRYVTIVRGERVLAAARPIGEGRYWLLAHGDHTELAYVLELPRECGPAQRTFNIGKQGRYIVAARNPDAASSAHVPEPRFRPSYPRDLRMKLGERGWSPVDDRRLLDYAHTQLLLLGMHQDAVAREELGISLEHEREATESTRIYELLGHEREAVPVDPLFKGSRGRTSSKTA